MPHSLNWLNLNTLAPMIIKSADYIASYIDVEKCPQASVPEFAFIGRSNVGKSSLINYLTGRKKLSKVSVTPGKTQTLNFFNINNKFQFVDLPGYSFAKVSKSLRNKWENMIRNYILQRSQLQYVFLLVDSRVTPQKIDLDFIDWMARKYIPFAIIYTKADKPGSRDVSTNVQLFENELLKDWEELPPTFTTSAEKKSGKDKLLSFIQSAVNEYYKTLSSRQEASGE